MSNLTKWYRGVKFPLFGSNMEVFIAPSCGLLSHMLPVSVPVTFESGIETACADQVNGRIVLSKNMFSYNEVLRWNKWASVENTLSAALGFVVHEGAHFAWSPGTVLDFFNPGVPQNALTAGIANVVEDLYIERRIITEFPALSWMIFDAWAYIFDKRITANGTDCAWDGVDVNANPQAMLNTFTGWKQQNVKHPIRSEFEGELYELFVSVFGMNNLQDRKDLVQTIVEKLIEASNAKANEKGEGGEGKSKSQDEAKSSSDKGESKPSSDKSPEKGDNSNDEGEGDEGQDEGEAEGSLAQELEKSERVEGKFDPTGKLVAVKFQKDMFPYRTQKESLEVKELDFINGYMVKTVISGSISAVVPSQKLWEKFGEVARQRGAVRRITGSAMMNGKNLTHPQNLFSGNVFSNATLNSTNGRIGQGTPEVILMLDFSGSMEGDKFKATMEAAYGAVKGMGDAGMKFAVYGYTTGGYGPVGPEINIYQMKSFAESVTVAKERISYLYRYIRGGEMNGTPDVQALGFAEKQFGPSGSDKVIIVVSDGGPTSSSDEEAAANVARIRAKGIRVFGLSIDKVADAPVKKIYSEDALFSSDPNVMEKFLQKFI